MLAPAANGAWAKFRRVVRRAAWLLGSALAASAVLVTALLLYLQSAPGRRFLAQQVSEFVSRELVSELRIERLDVISPRRLVASRAILADARGRTLLAVDGLEAEFELSSLLAHILFGPEVRVVVPEVRAERLEVGLYRDAHGDLVLANAFDPTTPSKTTASRPLRLRLPHVVVRSASVYNDEPSLARAKTEIADLTARLEVAPGLFELGIDTQRLRIAELLPVELAGALHGQVRLPGKTDATFAGALGTLPVSAQFEMRGPEISLRASSASLAPDGMKKLVPAWPLLAPVSANAELLGRFEALRAHADLSAGSSRLVASGTVAFTPEFTAALTFDARGVDLRLLAAGAPSTALAAAGDLAYHARPSARVEISGRLLEGELAGRPLPETNVHVVYAADELTGTAAVLDRRLPLDASFTLSRTGVLDFHARAQALALRALQPYGVSAEGVTNVDVAGELAHDELNARFAADGRALAVANVRARTASAKGTLRGPVARPSALTFDLGARGTGFVVGKVEFPSWEFGTQGFLAHQRVNVRAGAPKGSSLVATATVAVNAGVSVEDAHAEVEFAGTKALLEVAEARFAERRLDVRGLRLALADGELRGAVRIGPSEQHADLVVSDFDPAPLFPLFDLETKPFTGRIDARLSYDDDRRERHARLRGSVENGTVGTLGPIFGEVTATLDGSRLAGHATVSAASIGRGSIALEATLESGVTSLRELGAVPGELRLDFSELDLSELEHHFAPGAVAGINGRGAGAVWFARPEAARPLEAGYDLTVRDFTLNAGGSRQTDALVQVDIASRATLDATTTRVELDVNDTDGVWIRSGATVPRGTTRALEFLESGRADEVLDAPLRAEIVALPRPLAHLGGRTRSLPQGDFSGALSVTGTPAHPHVVGSLDVRHLAVAGLATENDVGLFFDYAAEREEYSLTARGSANGAQKLELTGGGHCGWFEHGFGSNFSLDARARAEKVALATLGDVLDVKLAGELSGRASLTASPSAVAASGDFAVKGLALERRGLGDGSGSFEVQQGSARGRLRLGDARSKLELSSELGFDWNGGAPRIDPRRGGSVEADVRNYELGVLAPLLRAFVSDVRGPINGFASLGFGPEDAAGKRKTTLRANASVSGGAFRLTSGIGGLQNAELRALANGDGTLHLTFSGAASSKQPNVSAKAEVLWDGLLPRRVEAELRAERVPVSYEGILLGTATIDKKARPLGIVVDLTDAEQRVKVSVPALDFELPVKEDTRLIELAPDAAVRVTDDAAAPAAVVVASEPSSLVISVELGDAVRLKQPDLLVPITGEIVRVADGRLDGALILPEGGTVSAFGQVFRLKKSSVRFAKQPVELGVLMIQASARTVEGVLVDLDVSGTVNKPVVRFRSDPPRSEGEIISLLLGIRPDDTQSVPGKQDVGGSAMALAMNQLLRNSPLAGFQFGETQSRTGDTISTVSFRAGNKVWLEGWSTRQNQGTPYETMRSSGVVDWRFAPGFSLRTQLGYPSGVEMRWSHRY